MRRFAALLVTAGLHLPLAFAAGCAANAPDPVAAEREEERRQAEYQGHLDRGVTAFAAEKYDDALREFEAAGKLSPGDAAVAGWLEKTREAREAHLTREYQKAMAAGRDALTAGKVRLALAAFRDAQKYRPNDPEAAALVKQHTLAGWHEKGNEELAAKKYAEAAATFLTASQQFPADAPTRELLKKAQDARRQEVRADYDRALAAGKSAAAAKNFESAAKAFGDALRLVPGDAEAGRLKADAEFDGLVHRGRLALDRQRPAEAIPALEAAARQRPADEAVKLLLAEAREARRAQVKAEFDRAMDAGKRDLSLKRYRDAVRHFKEAERLNPSDPDAGRLRRDAERVVSEYESLVSRTKSHISAKRYDDAIRTAQQAADLMPGETEPVVLKSQATTKKNEDSGRRRK